MKIIDLLNKIANGETPPKKISYQKMIFVYNPDEADYEYIEDTQYLLQWIALTKEGLNGEVEIIEDKKIEKIKPLLISDIIELLGNKTKNYQDEALRKLYEHIRNQDKIINEIIDKLEELDER